MFRIALVYDTSTILKECRGIVIQKLLEGVVEMGYLGQ